MTRFEDLKREEQEASARATKSREHLEMHIVMCEKGCKQPLRVGCPLGDEFAREYKLAFKEYERARKARER